jgi:hypothetical protein
MWCRSLAAPVPNAGVLLVIVEPAITIHPGIPRVPSRWGERMWLLLAVPAGDVTGQFLAR